jgi:predicted amidophosphoribosyltransferase
MAIISRGPQREEEPGGGSGLHLDLDLQVCPSCRRELHPWERTCPEDGAEAVPRTSLQRADLPPPPSHLLDDED